MPIERVTRPITPAELARFNEPVSVPVSRAFAAISLVGRGGCLLVCLGIGVGCLLVLDSFATPARIVLAVLAIALIGIGLRVAWPLASILIAAMTGRERLVPYHRVSPEATIEIWRIPSRRIFATDYTDDTLSWLIETDDGQFLLVFGEESLVQDDPRSVPGIITLATVEGRVVQGPELAGEPVPYVGLSETTEAALSHPFVTGLEMLDAAQVGRLMPLLEADARRWESVPVTAGQADRPATS
jgi:hypothetical protein